MLHIEAIACVDVKAGISKNGMLPWAGTTEGRADVQYMRQQTLMAAPWKKNIIIVGHTTFKTLPPKFYAEPTSVREMYILSSSPPPLPPQESLTYHSSPEELYLAVMDRYYRQGDIDRVFVFGGGEIYKIFLEKRWIHTFHLTMLRENYACDTFFPMELIYASYEVLRTSCELTRRSNLTVWTRRPHPEYAYLDLLQKVYYTGVLRETRNGAGDTRSLFGTALEFDVGRFGFPLLTTKKMFFKGIATELCWFLKADTDARHLQDKGVRIWDGNTSRAFLDQRGLTDYAEGQAGPIYGFQWRNFNGPYNTVEPSAVVLETVRDQLYACLQLLQNDPYSRRIVFSGWNPLQLADMCLPPCHVLYQFYVSADQALSCQMYQRSADLFLGLPFNIASTALLTSIFARLTNLSVGTIRINIGDAHLYSQHHECVRQQLTRTPLPFCQLAFSDETAAAAAAAAAEAAAEAEAEKARGSSPLPKKLEEFTPQDFCIHNYVSHGALKAPMIA